VNLVPLSAEHLRVNASLPFNVVDARGKLLVPKGTVIESEVQLQQLLAHRLFVEEEASQHWRRDLAGQIDRMVRDNVALKQIAGANAAPQPRAGAPRPPPLNADITVDVGDMQARAAALLRDPRPAADWVPRIVALAQRLRQLAARDADAIMYLLVQTTTQVVEHYSSHHALLCALVVDLCAEKLRWPECERTTLMHAALTMNLSMTTLQNVLAQQEHRPTPAQAAEIRGHAERSAAALAGAGIEDALWIEVVRLHHDDAHGATELAKLAAPQRLARLLRRVDVFTAKISPRTARVGLPAPLAARDACLGADGRPDEVGAAMVKTLGIYPPGSFVKLTSGEIAVVLRRGLRANHPRVASLVSRDGDPLGEPAPRDCADPRFEIRGAVRVDAVRVRLNHRRVLRLAPAR
jgi:HD-GYP domain-containing protein (c-di-GMP phosphodiesterase class II)